MPIDSTRGYRGRFQPQDVAERFWRYVTKTDTCWLWTGATRPNGYGVLSIQNRAVRVHRISYEMHFGPIPAGLLVCHRCDVRNCIRPDHLFLGTYRENNHDMMAKDRFARGERAKAAKLTAADVIAIRRQYTEGATMQALAERYGVSLVQVHRIIHRKRWQHVA